MVGRQLPAGEARLDARWCFTATHPHTGRRPVQLWPVHPQVHWGRTLGCQAGSQAPAGASDAVRRWTTGAPGPPAGASWRIRCCASAPAGTAPRGWTTGAQLPPRGRHAWLAAAPGQNPCGRRSGRKESMQTCHQLARCCVVKGWWQQRSRSGWLRQFCFVCRLLFSVLPSMSEGAAPLPTLCQRPKKRQPFCCHPAERPFCNGCSCSHPVPLLWGATHATHLRHSSTSCLRRRSAGHTSFSPSPA